MLRYLLLTNDFSDAALEAAKMDLHLSEWLWAPHYTAYSGVQVFEIIDQN
jgi:hypothetical protein